MTRYFYDDPLAPAWMAKHFDMRFEILKPKIDKDAGIIEIPYFSGAFIGVKMYDGSKFLGSRPHHTDELLYIHPDSLHLLEPQVGDIALRDGEPGVIFKNGAGYIGWACGSESFPISDGLEIIQRNGIPFMWSKEEKL